ncbi:hypothetical protein [Bifidobacterium bifidum]|uniref:hypothetical protein n=1 Tax=Bifidobacterium bifidum TaxID=1681 RepID=UPI0012AB9673|nr:hypothetical protein [Bifidobacterium bifidum]
MNIIIGGLKINTAKGELDASPLAHKSGILNLTLAENSANELIAGAFHAGLEKNDVNGAPDETFALNIDSQGDGADAGYGLARPVCRPVYGQVQGRALSLGERTRQGDITSCSSRTWESVRRRARRVTPARSR